MKVNFIQQSQDIILFLSREEFEELTKKLKNEFFDDNCIRTPSKEAQAHFFLGYSSDSIGMFVDAEEENGIQLIRPDTTGDSYYINLQDEAIKTIKQTGFVGMRYLGGAKLHISVQD